MALWLISQTLGRLGKIPYKLSCAYAQQRSLEPALANLAHAINLEAKYLEMAKVDSDFDHIRDQSQFQILLNSSAN